jgi:lipid-A-disaccharide synthase
LLPGSRAQEVANLFPLFLEAARALPGRRFVVPAASDELYEALKGAPGVEVTRGNSLEVLGRAEAALVASGTATLEAALLGVPCVAAYKVSRLTAAVARRVLQVPYVTLPNIVAGREVIPELLQERAEPAGLARALEAVMAAPGSQLAGFAEVREKLGGPGAIARAAHAILADAGLVVEGHAVDGPGAGVVAGPA